MTSRRRAFVRPLLPLLASAATACAGIEWDATERSFKAKPGEEQAVAEFHFKNTGPGVLTVRRVKSSCGCTAAGVDEDVLKPGAGATLTAVFRFGNRIGQQEKVVVVETDDARQPSSVLKLRVEIPEVLRPEPRTVIWEKSEPLTPKTVTITVAEGAEIGELTATSSSRQVAVKLSGPDPGTRGYSLTVAPEKSDRPIRAVVTICAKLRPPGERTASVYVAVMQGARQTPPPVPVN
jgi:hypothetical protein